MLGTVKRNEQTIWHDMRLSANILNWKKRTTTTKLQKKTEVAVDKSEREWKREIMLTSWQVLFICCCCCCCCCCNFISSHSPYTSHWMKIFLLILHTQWQSVSSLDSSWKWFNIQKFSLINNQTTKLLLLKKLLLYRRKSRKRWAKKYKYADLLLCFMLSLKLMCWMWYVYE